MRKISQRITLYNPDLTGFLLKEVEAKTKCSGIINLLFGFLVDNTLRHFTAMARIFPHPYATRKISARIIYQNTEYSPVR